MSSMARTQYLVASYLCTDPAASRDRALLTSGAIVLVQFIAFFLSACYCRLYHPFFGPGLPDRSPPRLFLSPVATAFFQTSLRSICPLVVRFLRGCDLAAAMSSSLNSIAATAVNDLYRPLRPRLDDRHYLKVFALY